MSRKLIDLQGLAEFKRKCDETYSGGIGGSDVYNVQDFELDLEEKTFTMSSDDAAYIFENKPAVINFETKCSAVLSKYGHDDKEDYGYCSYTYIDTDGETYIVVYDFLIDYDSGEYEVDFKYTEEIGGSGGGSGATKKEIDLTDNSDEWTQAQMEDVYTNKYDIVSVVTSSNTTVLRKVSEYQGFGVLYWTFMPQQGIVINIFVYDEQDGYDIQTQTRMPIVTMEVDGNDVMSQDQTTLQEIYEKQPDILYVDAGNDGEQSYRKQTAKDDTVSYSCLIGGYMIVVVYITEDRNATPHTYSIRVDRYDLSSLLVSN